MGHRHEPLSVSATGKKWATDFKCHRENREDGKRHNFCSTKPIWMGFSLLISTSWILFNETVEHSRCKSTYTENVRALKPRMFHHSRTKFLTALIQQFSKCFDISHELFSPITAPPYRPIKPFAIPEDTPDENSPFIPPVPREFSPVLFHEIDFEDINPKWQLDSIPTLDLPSQESPAKKQFYNRSIDGKTVEWMNCT